MIRHVVRKELRDHWRDRRSVLGAMVLPVLGPLMLMLVFNLIADRQGETRTEVAIAGREHAGDVVRLLEQYDVSVIDAPENVEEAVKTGDPALVVRFDESFPKDIAAGKAGAVDLVYDASNQNAISARIRVERLIEGYGKQVAFNRLIARGLDPELATPVIVKRVDLATARQAAAQALSIIPLMLVLMAFIGGMNVAIDTTAGERERGSLEPLLLNPVARWSLVVGKWIATSAFALGVLSIGLLGFFLTATYLPRPDIGFVVEFGLHEVGLTLALVAPLALLGSVVQMGVAMFAKTFKEAQTYLSLFNFVPIAPAMYLMFEGTNGAEAWMAWVPALGQIAAVFDIVAGQEVATSYILASWAACIVYTILALIGLSKMMRRESVIYGR